MKIMKTKRGTSRSLRRAEAECGWKKDAKISGMLPPSLPAQAQMLSDRQKANRKLGIKMFLKHGSAPF